MKIGGVAVEGPNREVLVLPRPTNNIVIQAETVTNFDEFEALVPEPSAPGVRTKGGFKKDTNAPRFKEDVKRYEDLRWAWMIIQSLTPSEIEWEKVDAGSPGTWLGWSDELLEAGLSQVEVNKITLLVLQANSLDEKKLQAAREAFLLGQGAEASESSGQSTELESTSSGEPAND